MSTCSATQNLHPSLVMSKRRKFVIAVLFCMSAVAVIAFLAHRQDPEPAYAGHPLSFWVEILGRRSPPWGDTQGATNAIAHIGPASLPLLLKWIQHEPAQWRDKLAAPLKRLPYEWTHWLSACIAQERSEQLAIGTYEAFHILGTRATPALEDLSRLMNATNATATSARATENLGCLGTNALAALLAVIQDPRHPRQWQAVAAVGSMPDMGDAAKLSVPAIIACIGNTNDETLSLMAVNVIGRLRAAPDLSVPALVCCLQSTNAIIRISSAEAIAAFGTQATSAIPALTNMLTDPDPELRDCAAKTLHEIAPSTFTNVPPPHHID
ncbi:MAG: HEAT repeat domain-containing protein [Verrucomicrobia bacterium]|nr:MAG: HEAT repeat domain-containing protein [Verrucomicrobiota bacterium]